MKRFRLARQIRLTSRKKVKRVGNKYYQGGSDPNKGSKKRTWYEMICSKCLKRFKVEPTGKFKCRCSLD